MSHAEQAVKFVLQWDCENGCGDISMDNASVVAKTGRGLDVDSMVSRQIELKPGAERDLNIVVGR